MTLKSAFAGLAALAGLAAAGPASAAMPNGLPTGATQQRDIENIRLVCDIYGRCYRTPRYYYGGPRYFGGGYGYARPRFYGGYGYGGGRHFGRRW
jgi:hypothetical protein